MKNLVIQYYIDIRKYSQPGFNNLKPSPIEEYSRHSFKLYCEKFNLDYHRSIILEEILKGDSANLSRIEMIVNRIKNVKAIKYETNSTLTSATGDTLELVEPLRTENGNLKMMEEF